MKQAFQLQHAGAAATVLAPKQEHKLYFQLLQELSSTIRGRGTNLPQEHQGRQRFGGRGAARPVHTGGHRPPTAPSHTSSMQWCIITQYGIVHWAMGGGKTPGEAATTHGPSRRRARANNAALMARRARGVPVRAALSSRPRRRVGLCSDRPSGVKLAAAPWVRLSWRRVFQWHRACLALPGSIRTASHSRDWRAPAWGDSPTSSLALKKSIESSSATRSLPFRARARMHFDHGPISHAFSWPFFSSTEPVAPTRR